ncbi:MAG TPA: NAD-glutamate dehydrogenase, partial [Casimicrobiaceae bacterium]|nr:NAD-glutamate dehydrogenase [Casimicrobiaceae bacterium]
DELHTLLLEQHGEEQGNRLFARYGEAFPAAYRDDFPARNAVYDIQRIEDLEQRGGLNMNLYRPLEATSELLRFKLFFAERPLPLSDAVPMLEDMGVEVVEERPYEIRRPGAGPVWIHDFGMSYARDRELDMGKVRDVFQEAFAAILRSEAESDGFNRLVLGARLTWREIVILRACCKYLRQTRLTFSQEYMEQALAGNPAIARGLVELFQARFDPARPADADRRAERLRGELTDAIDQVANLDEDRILRSFLGMVEATLRTNYHQTGDGARPKPYLSFKLDPTKVPSLPKPRPMFEVFVYSPRTEAVHLRGGRVARGGIRWSDRREDFRTEVLGLMKAQIVKNAVIVPVGAKGGFVVKRPPADGGREALQDEVVACYSTFMRGLLDLTDNRAADGRVVPPPDVVRYDDDDPYLVVAADKGTATFSDLANSIAAEYGFWLDDAFASGGSAGYDHKVMGITARGAWESVKRHFREMGVDTQTTDFTVAGIGDMSGDVFGNGMLLSRHIKLVAAFDHRHIFLDPHPDPESSFKERERVFKLPRSSWADYDAKLISAGGGIHPRSAKSIAVTPEVKEALAISANALTPTELVNAILKAPVDLIYNGGIGTYVKAQSETHAQVGDRANDALRVNGRELRCRAFAEGGNLGCTQLGRIEYALSGGRINTDAIDNSAGVDTSDHEVNIKILLGLPIAEGELTEKQRNALLAEMTDDVAALVLRDNVFQTQSLSVTGRIAPHLLDAHQRFIQFLEKTGRLNRALEFLPSDEEIAERRAKGIGLTSPERAVLLAYSKIWLYDELLASTLPDDSWVATALARYFPKALRERYATYMPRHPLKREIIATYVDNSMVNRVGSTFVHQLLETTGAKPYEIVRAYLLNREIFGFVELWKAIEALDNEVDDAVQSAMLLDTSRLIVRGTTWFLRSRRLAEDMAGTIAHFTPQVAALATRLPQLLDPGERVRVDNAVAAYVAKGVPQPLAARVVTFDTLYAALDIVEVAGTAKRPVETIAELYFALATRFGLPWLREKIAALPGDAHWQILAKGAMQDDLSSLQRTITAEVLHGGADSGAPAKLVAAWEDRNRRSVERAVQLFGELRASSAVDAAMLSVALRELRNLV